MGNVSNTQGLKNYGLDRKGVCVGKNVVFVATCAFMAAHLRGLAGCEQPPSSMACVMLSSPHVWPGRCRHCVLVLHSHGLTFLPILGGKKMTSFCVISRNKSLHPIINSLQRGDII